MSDARYEICFGSGESPIQLSAHANLSEHLSADNSPVLFGCRTGLCGTCVIGVEALSGEISPPDEDEQEVLALYSEHPQARLACQIQITANLRLFPLPTDS